MKLSQEKGQPLVVRDNKKAKLIEIKTETRRQDVVDMLTTWLKMAETGEITGIAGIAFLKGYETEWVITGTTGDDIPRTVGTLDLLKHDVMCRVDEELEDIDPSDPTG
jgi:hypothetical protein